MTSDRGEPSAIDLSSNLSHFFGQVVVEAIREHGYEATAAAEHYVVGLLTDYARPDQLSGETLARPLTLLLAEALETNGPERFARLRSLGDGVLYVSGFFGEHLEMRGVELGYVSSVGARAYESAGSLLRRAGSQSDGGAPDLFRELSQNFSMFVQLLGHVADSLFASSAHTPTAMVKLYERWRRSGSRDLAEALVARGMVPQRGDGTLH
jgi:hypothetical protein